MVDRSKFKRPEGAAAPFDFAAAAALREQRAKDLLLRHKHDLDKLAKALLEHETLTGAEIVDLLAGACVRAFG